MYAKVFTQILDSSIAEDYEVRHVFEDLLKLADKEGNVDMTIEAIARRTNVPIDIVRRGIAELEKPDPSSRTKEFDGKRIIPIDPKRGWGWFIVNYQHYRAIQDEEARRAAFRDAKRRQREKEASKKAGMFVGKSPKIPRNPPPDDDSNPLQSNDGLPDQLNENPPQYNTGAV